MCDCGCGAACNDHCWNTSQWEDPWEEDMRGELAYFDEDVGGEEEEGSLEESDQFLCDLSQDGDALKSAGWGTDEDYHLEEQYEGYWEDQ